MRPKAIVVILAGGKGERLYPLTKDRAKPAVPFGGIYRIIDFTLSNCINSSLRRIYILTQYKSFSLSRHINLGWNILSNELYEYIEVIPPQKRISEDWYRGTADAVYQNIYSIRTENPDYVIVLSGDHLYKMNYNEMLEFHIAKKAEVTVSAIEMDIHKSHEFGVLEIYDNYRIIGFEEKPQKAKPIPFSPDECFMSMGIYIFNTKTLLKTLEDDSGLDTYHDFGKNIIPGLVKENKDIYAYNFKDENKKKAKYWRDVGTIEAYWEANMDLVSVNPQFNLYDPDWPLHTYQPQYPPAKFVFAQEKSEGGRRGIALDSIVSNGCIISGGKVQNSILSSNVRINSYSDVQESILLEGVNVGRYAKIKRAIIDKGVVIPPGTVIGYNHDEDAEKYKITDSNIIVIPRFSEIQIDSKPEKKHNYDE
ncbi:MAG: glucose-1-phosphate adenylyltransferase [Candidatus Firestonebacteria bacterium]|nr:glucose-1-phosphate adenylyltransferase [Candidatus Firestonebacteria bacterium]